MLSVGSKKDRVDLWEKQKISVVDVKKKRKCQQMQNQTSGLNRDNLTQM